MTKLRARGWFTAILAETRQQDTTGKPDLLRTRWLVVLFCAAAAIASPAQTFTTLASFDDINGANPFYGSLVRGPNENFFGTTEIGGSSSNDGEVFEVSSTTGVLRAVHRFCAETGCTDGRSPSAGLILAADQQFYGTTTYGGAY